MIHGAMMGTHHHFMVHHHLPPESFDFIELLGCQDGVRPGDHVEIAVHQRSFVGQDLVHVLPDGGCVNPVVHHVFHDIQMQDPDARLFHDRRPEEALLQLQKLCDLVFRQANPVLVHQIEGDGTSLHHHLPMRMHVGRSRDNVHEPEQTQGGKPEKKMGHFFAQHRSAPSVLERVMDGGARGALRKEPDGQSIPPCPEREFCPGKAARDEVLDFRTL